MAINIHLIVFHIYVHINVLHPTSIKNASKGKQNWIFLKRVLIKYETCIDCCRSKIVAFWRFSLFIWVQLIQLGDIFFEKQLIQYRIAKRDLFIAIFRFYCKNAISSILSLYKMHPITISQKMLLLSEYRVYNNIFFGFICNLKLDNKNNRKLINTFSPLKRINIIEAFLILIVILISFFTSYMSLKKKIF